MKAFYTALIAAFIAFGFALGSAFESAAPLTNDGPYLWQRIGGPDKEEKGNVFGGENFILPLEKIKEPMRKSGASGIDIAAKSVLAIDDASGKILYEKESDKKMAIASLTKLATAVTVLEFVGGSIGDAENGGKKYDLNKDVVIDKTAIEAEGDSASLAPGEKIKARDLLAMMLVASSNDAAVALAEDIAQAQGYSGGIRDFVQAMNNVAEVNNLAGTHFSNPTGMDEKNHYSTAGDVVKTAKIFLRNYPDFFQMTKLEELDVKSQDGKNIHRLKNTNALLGGMPEIEGGKTGYTDEAGESLLVVAKNPISKARIIAVVIGADDRFLEMKKLVNWIWGSYEWK